MQLLIDIGFRIAGEWRRRNNHRDQLQFEPCHACSHPNVLYAFAVGDEVAYVGKTVRGLHERMRDYATGITSAEPDTTNHRNARKILEKLREGNKVHVYALEDWLPIQIGAFAFNLAAGLEDSIIAVINPPWNQGKKEVLMQADAERVFAPAALPQAQTLPLRPPEPTPAAATPALHTPSTEPL
jgi:hypothetical protein